MTKNLKAILTTAVLLIILISVGCSDSGDSSNPTDYVTMTEKPNYWEVHIDYSSGDRYKHRPGIWDQSPIQDSKF